jgi:hypothetical protein
MVAIDPKDWDRQRNKAARPESELTQYDKDIIGSGVRIEIPFQDLEKLREMARMLRQLADSIDGTTRRDDMPLRAILMSLMWEARAINARIKEMHGMSRKWT